MDETHRKYGECLRGTIRSQFRLIFINDVYNNNKLMFGNAYQNGHYF